MENRIYRHISDCWQALREATSIEEVEKLFGDFPRWSGDWEWFYDNGSFCVRNDWFDKDTGTEDYDIEELENLSAPKCEEEEE